MNLAVIVLAYLQVISTNNVKHCTQLILVQETESYRKNHLTQEYISDIIRKDVANYILKTPDELETNDQIVRSSSGQVARFQYPCTLSVAFSSNEITLNNSFVTLDKLNRHILRKEHDFFVFIYLSKVKYERFHQNIQLMAVDFRFKLFVAINWNNNTASYLTTFPYYGNGNPSTVLLKSPHFSDGLNNFNGKLFRITTPTSTTSLIELRHQFQHNWIPVRGYQKFALEHLMRRYNFTATFFPSVGGGGTGSRFPNGTWVGSVGDILNGQADIGLSSAQIYARNLVVDFTLPMGYTWLTFTTGKVLPHYSWKSTYWPLSPKVWQFALISSLATVGAFSLIQYFRSKLLQASYTINFMVRSLLEQDVKIGCKDESVRVLGAFWLIFGLLITTAYRCKLVPMLAYPVLEQPPTTFSQLASANHYQISLQYVRGAAYVLLKTSPNPTLKTIFKRMMQLNVLVIYLVQMAHTKVVCRGLM